MIESLRSRDLLLVAALAVQVGQDVIHTAVFGVENALHLTCAQLCRSSIDPAGQREQCCLGVGVADIAPDTEPPLHGLVYDIVGNVAVGELALLQCCKV